MAHFREQFWYPNEVLAANVRADIFPRNSNIHASIFSDAALTIPMANPTTTDGSGFLDFYVATGTYWAFLKELDFERHINDGTELSFGSFVKQYQEDLGDGVATSFLVTHNLGNGNPAHSIMDNATFEDSTAEVTHTSVNSVTVVFNDPPGVDAFNITLYG